MARHQPPARHRRSGQGTSEEAGPVRWLASSTGHQRSRHDSGLSPSRPAETAGDPAPPARRERNRGAPGGGGVEANARLTGMTAVLLFVLLAVEGVTIVQVGPLLTPHVVIGMVLVPPVLLKIGSTSWRFARYYLGAPEYRRKGPPPALLRLLGPVVVVLTVAVLATGIVLLLGPPGIRQESLFLHKATFILWIAAMTIHVLGHLVDTARLAPRDFYRRTRRQVRGAGARQWALVAAVVIGLLLAVAVAPRIGPWRSGAVPAGPHPTGAADMVMKSRSHHDAK